MRELKGEEETVARPPPLIAFYSRRIPDAVYTMHPMNVERPTPLADTRVGLILGKTRGINVRDHNKEGRTFRVRLS